MKKTYVKYFGVASATLLAAAPVVAPAIQGALNTTATNQVFATDNTGTVLPMDLSAQNEYGQLLQHAINNATAPMTTINGSLVSTPGSKSGVPGNIYKVQDGGYNANTLAGLIRLAKISNGAENSIPLNAFVSQSQTPVPLLNNSDVLKYLFTNTDGSIRNNTSDFYYDNTLPMRINTQSNDQSVVEIRDAAKFLSDKLGGRNVSDILGSALFGNPNKASLSIEINGTNDPNKLDIKSLLSQGRIVITLTATSDSKMAGGVRTAKAFLNLENSNVLLPGATGTFTGNSGDAKDYKEVLGSYANTSNLSDIANLYSSSGSTFNPQVITGLKTVTDTSNSGYSAYASAAASSTGIVPFNSNGNSYTTDQTSAAVAGVANKVGAYAKDTIIVPEGTSLKTIVSQLQKIRYNGAPSVNSYSRPTLDKGALAFDNVKANDNSEEAWLNLLGGSLFESAGGNQGVTQTLNYLRGNQSMVSAIAAPGQIALDVPVSGDVFLPTTNNSGNYVFSTTNSSKAYINNYNQATARVNIVVYPNPGYWNQKYTTGTKPSFALFAPVASDGRLVPTFYDDGSTVKSTDLPVQLQSKTLNLSVGDSRFYDANSKTVSQNKLNSYFKAAFGSAIINHSVLISDEDTKTSDRNINTTNIDKVPDTDFPNANLYLVRPGDVTQYAGDGGGFDNYGGYTVDASAVDLSKAGTYLVKYTYVNSKSEHNVGTETSTISIPVTVGNSEAPVFYFVNGLDQTITQGDNFNQYMFKVSQNNDALNALVQSGKVYDGAPYIDDPSGTGITVTVSGTVDTNRPGRYNLTYTATNLRNGTSTTLTRTVTVLAKGSDSTITDFNGIGYINYVPGYGINVYDGPKGSFTGQRLQHGTDWKISHKSVVDGKTWYQVGTGQWIDGSYVQFNPVNNMKAASGVVTVSYVPGYSIRVWGSADNSNPTEEMLANGTSWQIFGELNGFYNVGTNQWIEKQYVTENK